jgi:hypothetical protein
VEPDTVKHGTSLNMNEEDPTGSIRDGNQSFFSIANETNAQFHRKLWACGGNLIFQRNYYSPGAQLCISGSYPELVLCILALLKTKQRAA